MIQTWRSGTEAGDRGLGQGTGLQSADRDKGCGTGAQAGLRETGQGDRGHGAGMQVALELGVQGDKGATMPGAQRVSCGEGMGDGEGCLQGLVGGLPMGGV